MTVAELLTGPEKWTQEEGARDANGVKCHFNDPAAACWCLLSAIYHCYPATKAREIEMRLIEKLFGPFTETNKRRTGDCLSVWNDTHTFAEVRRLVVKEGI